jgi:hypothetical protein
LLSQLFFDSQNEARRELLNALSFARNIRKKTSCIGISSEMIEQKLCTHKKYTRDHTENRNMNLGIDSPSQLDLPSDYNTDVHKIDSCLCGYSNRSSLEEEEPNSTEVQHPEN